VIFTSVDFCLFLVFTLVIYWAIRNRHAQNAFLVIMSYLCYGWIHPWFSMLLLFQSTTDYLGALGMKKYPTQKTLFLGTSLLINIGLLSLFKYFNFFTTNTSAFLTAIGLTVRPTTLQLLLPAGISFYTFETISYSLDVYRGNIEPRTNFIDYSLFIAFFPHLIAGPIQRAGQFLPQLETPRVWKQEFFDEAWPLLIRGYVEKLVIADNVAVYADKVFMLKTPSLMLLLAGTLSFALQIYADFMAYTDIARGVSLLFGLRLSQNFDSPYLAISPSDFWRRWHITFSTWVRDYLYIPLGGSRVNSPLKFAIVILITMGLSGLWHGAQWHFVIWGLYHGLLLFIYHRLGWGGRWRPQGIVRTGVAWCAMFGFTLFGWLLFRSPSLHWLVHTLQTFDVGLNGDSFISAVTIFLFVAYYSLPLFLWMAIDRALSSHRWIPPVLYGCTAMAIVMLAPEKGKDFIYFQF